MTRSQTARTLSPLAAAPRLPLTALFAVKVATLITQWDHRYRSRNDLARLEDHLLDDIGMTRKDAMKEAKRPFWLP
ncbi:MAG: hypothetical protein CML66_30540 [Rhodobacteraceae bacterium]|nr:hypothetical protein [Paracoccaceae bacterium]MAY47997.1 hypothetical protein [Paracoccaceae bacterium]QEW20613.1 hypothetical protein LA6_002812 [Marinibacterium anthonyi]